MMKIEHLVDNRELVMEILKNWEFNKENLEILNQYRISSNAVYPFWNKEKVQILRFSPKSEKMPETINAEIEYLEYLRRNGLLVPDIVLSRKQESLVTVLTKWGEYSAVVFGKVEGKRLDKIELTDDLIINYGKELGKLHKLSQKYKAVDYKRVTHTDQFNWMKKILSAFPDECSAIEELRMISNMMSEIERTDLNYGLIHYDYELDNVFYDEESKHFSIIDFDDAHYNWYVVDIIKSVDNILEELPSMSENDVFNLLIEGYNKIISLDQSLLGKKDVFRRYIRLYSFVRAIRAIGKLPDIKPGWMDHLVNRIRTNLEVDRCQFGK